MTRAKAEDSNGLDGDFTLFRGQKPEDSNEKGNL